MESLAGSIRALSINVVSSDARNSAIASHCGLAAKAIEASIERQVVSGQISIDERITEFVDPLAVEDADWVQAEVSLLAGTWGPYLPFR